jgi:hypothetical protein
MINKINNYMVAGSGFVALILLFLVCLSFKLIAAQVISCPSGHQNKIVLEKGVAKATCVPDPSYDVQCQLGQKKQAVLVGSNYKTTCVADEYATQVIDRAYCLDIYNRVRADKGTTEATRRCIANTRCGQRLCP